MNNHYTVASFLPGLAAGLQKSRPVFYTPLKCFNNFVQSAVNGRKEGDENPKSSVVAEIMKLLANSSYA